MNSFTIKDLENLSGIKAHTIRIWEQRYSFLKPKRTGTNIRYYSNEELKTVLNIALLNKYGFKISHIERMNEGELQENLVTLSQAPACHERIVNELIHGMIDLEMDKFENLLDAYILSKGIDKAMHQVIFPFLERIGILWHTDRIHAVQEHLVSNIIRQKMIVGIEAVVNHMFVNKTVLLFLPEGEHHEIGLLYMFYLLKKRGVRVLYLGANVPLKDIEFICRQKNPDFLHTHITCMAGPLSFDRFMAQKNKYIKDIPLIISGQLAQSESRKNFPAVYFKRSLPEVMEYVSAL
jgi:MerR family transcriptional regulator, light-induced transcriptional regulator